MYAVIANNRFYAGEIGFGWEQKYPKITKVIGNEVIFCHVNKHFLQKHYPYPSSGDKIKRITRLPSNITDLSVVSEKPIRFH